MTVFFVPGGRRRSRAAEGAYRDGTVQVEAVALARSDGEGRGVD